MIRNILRWLILLIFICTGLLYLNSAAFKAWVSGGPPTDYPKLWLHGSLVHFGYSLSLFTTGIMFFISLKAGFVWSKSKFKYVWLMLLLLCLGYPKIKKWILIDKCLDSGGSWNSEYFECKEELMHNKTASPERDGSPDNADTSN